MAGTYLTFSIGQRTETMRKILIFILAVSTTILTACTTMSKQECETADWNKLGYKDASVGKTTEMFERRQNACSKHEIVANESQYAHGYTEGLKIFCTYDSGVDYGHTGAHYAHQCPRDLETEFMKGYRLGKAEHERDALKSELEDKERELRDKEAENLRLK